MQSAGRLNRRVTLQQRQTGRDSLGQPSTQYQDVVQVWASIRHKTGLAAIKGGAETSLVQASIRIRPRPGITTGQRIQTEAGEHYQIQAILPDERGEYLDLVCEAVQ